MENVPKIVQARLPRAMPHAAEGHPDADVLTAFAEQALGESERQKVMGHLAGCGDCREVVALALPASEAITVPSSSRPARGGWLSWPVLRWGVVAAGIALVTSVGILQYRQHGQQNVALVSSALRPEQKVAALQNPQLSEPAPAAQPIVPRAAELAKQMPLRKAYGAQSALAANPPSSSLNGIFSAPRTMRRAGAEAGIGSGAIASQNASGQPSPSAPSQQVVQAQSAEMAAEDQLQGQQPVVAQNQMELSPQKQPLSNSDVVRAKDSVPPQAGSGVVFAPAGSGRSVTLSKGLGLSPLWAIGSGGALQRSIDGGATWEAVNVSAASPAKNARAQSAADRKDQFVLGSLQKKDKASAVVFRAVAALGPDVWAGGSASMLYHSLDSGNHWTQVVPSEANFSLAGDILSVEFSDTQHGKITTSSGEVWVTGDDGQTWHKQ
jgi:Photosynthesis system II assembly factor YCF48